MAIAVGIGANGNHVIPRFRQIPTDRLRNVPANIDTGFTHYLNGLLVYFLRRLGAGRTNRQTIVERVQKCFCHLTAATVAGAKNKYFHQCEINFRDRNKHRWVECLRRIAGKLHWLCPNSPDRCSISLWAVQFRL